MGLIAKSKLGDLFRRADGVLGIVVRLGKIYRQLQFMKSAQLQWYHHELDRPTGALSWQCKQDQRVIAKIDDAQLLGECTDEERVFVRQMLRKLHGRPDMAEQPAVKELPKPTQGQFITLPEIIHPLVTLPVPAGSSPGDSAVFKIEAELERAMNIAQREILMHATKLSVVSKSAVRQRLKDHIAVLTEMLEL